MNSSSGHFDRFSFSRALIQVSCLLFLLGSFAFAQTSNTSLSGVVKDPQGNVIADATVVLTNAATATSRSQKNGAGRPLFFRSTHPWRLQARGAGCRVPQTTPAEHSRVDCPSEHGRSHNAGRRCERGSYRKRRIHPGDGGYPRRESGQQFHLATDYAASVGSTQRALVADSSARRYEG